ncbi:MAG TPA: UrcA family protein [Caulobacteraceae bacterium]|nr:UrcA family protein [Caulobacteraceae bacterium]
MNSEAFAIRTKHFALAAAALASGWLSSSGPAVAQQVEVIAPRIVVHQAGQMASNGLPVERITLTREVGYGDLDLTTQAGVATLQTRINDTAKQSCAQLDAFYSSPNERDISQASNQNCVSDAVDSAMAQVRLIEAPR